MTNEDLAEAEALVIAAGSGPWVYGCDEKYGPSICGVWGITKRGSMGWIMLVKKPNDQERRYCQFIAAAKQLVPQLISEVRYLRSIVEETKP